MDIACSRLIFLSPHCDDIPIMYGGMLHAWRSAGILASKHVLIVEIFSRTNYQCGDHLGNCDTSLKRIQYATGIRILEDQNCLDELLGFGAYDYQLLGEPEALLRGKKLTPGEKIEFPYGSKEMWSEADYKAAERLSARFATWMRDANTALFVPLAIREHIDHVVVREAALKAMAELGTARRAEVYFGEDLPYAGQANKVEFEKPFSALQHLRLEALDVAVDPRGKADLVFKHYVSQVEESYRGGMITRAEQIAAEKGLKDMFFERLYRAK